MERESDLVNCNNCPEEPGRFCMRYKAGKARLVFRPTYYLTGRKYCEPFSIDVSINDCPFRQQIARDNGAKADVAS